MLSDQPEVINDCVSELERVAVGKGMLVLVVRANCDALSVGDASWAFESAEQPKTAAAAAKTVLMVSM